MCVDERCLRRARPEAQLERLQVSQSDLNHLQQGA